MALEVEHTTLLENATLPPMMQPNALFLPVAMVVQGVIM
jgi:hypothetical protein